ncbi:hypothetical protein [Streptomyces niveiscabiei]|uniref:Uncharacterized protein n=1 Tax=Streptomyces niveiscabiei TaxID=164115 RepID=A0ABW9HRQ7_9ACTN
MEFNHAYSPGPPRAFLDYRKVHALPTDAGQQAAAASRKSMRPPLP